MDISCFDDLLQAARAQPLPQRLLLVFASADLPEDSTPAQRQRFQAGQGGALVPVMCVDKTPDELHSFADLVEESVQMTPAWSMVFASSLSGTPGIPPGSAVAEQALERMVASIKSGQLAAMVPFDRQGQAVSLGC